MWGNNQTIGKQVHPNSWQSFYKWQRHYNTWAEKKNVSVRRDLRRIQILAFIVEFISINPITTTMQLVKLKNWTSSSSRQRVVFHFDKRQQSWKPWLKKTIWVIGVLRRTVVSDWRFDNLCGSHLQRRWLPHRLSKRQSLTTVLLRTPITQMVFFNHGMLLLGSNHFLIELETFFERARLFVHATREATQSRLATRSALQSGWYHHMDNRTVNKYINCFLQ